MTGREIASKRYATTSGGGAHDARWLIDQVQNGEMTKERAELVGTFLFDSWALQSTLNISVG